VASTITIRVDGLSALGERMRGLSAKVANKVSARATGKAGALVKRAAKTNLRARSVETGLLERNVIVKKVPKSRTTLTSEHIVTVKKAVYPQNSEGGRRTTRRVGVFKEFGTVDQAAEPWLRPALDRNIQPAIQAMKDALEAGIIKEGA